MIDGVNADGDRVKRLGKAGPWDTDLTHWEVCKCRIRFGEDPEGGRCSWGCAGEGWLPKVPPIAEVVVLVTSSPPENDFFCGNPLIVSRAQRITTVVDGAERCFVEVSGYCMVPPPAAQYQKRVKGPSYYKEGEWTWKAKI